MARLNTHLSATPQTRATTVDSLYRDPSVAPQHDANARTSSYPVMSPPASMASDKENEQPRTRDNTPRPTKARGPRGASARMPTPDSGSTTGNNANKRRRTGRYNLGDVEIFQDEAEEEEEEEGDGEEQEEEDTPEAPEGPDEDEAEDLKFYNPNQNPDQRRRLRASMRDHARDVEGECRNKPVSALD
jgi:hypothetical protein